MNRRPAPPACTQELEQRSTRVFHTKVLNEDFDPVAGYEDRQFTTMGAVLTYAASVDFTMQFGVVDLETVAVLCRAPLCAYVDVELSLRFPHRPDPTGYTLVVEGPAAP